MNPRTCVSFCEVRSVPASKSHCFFSTRSSFIFSADCSSVFQSAYLVVGLIDGVVLQWGGAHATFWAWALHDGNFSVSCQCINELVCLPCSAKFSLLSEMEAFSCTETVTETVKNVRKRHKKSRNKPLGINQVCLCVHCLATFPCLFSAMEVGRD